MLKVLVALGQSLCIQLHCVPVGSIASAAKSVLQYTLNQLEDGTGSRRACVDVWMDRHKISSLYIYVPVWRSQTLTPTALHLDLHDDNKCSANGQLYYLYKEKVLVEKFRS